MKANHEYTRDIYECNLNHEGNENKLFSRALSVYLYHHFQMLNDSTVQRSNANIYTYKKEKG